MLANPASPSQQFVTEGVTNGSVLVTNSGSVLVMILAPLLVGAEAAFAGNSDRLFSRTLVEEPAAHSFVCLIASFYLVDRGLWHRLPGISSLRPAWWSPSRGSVGSDANGHTTVVSL